MVGTKVNRSIVLILLPSHFSQGQQHVMHYKLLFCIAPQQRYKTRWVCECVLVCVSTYLVAVRARTLAWEHLSFQKNTTQIHNLLKVFVSWTLPLCATITKALTKALSLMLLHWHGYDINTEGNVHFSIVIDLSQTCRKSLTLFFFFFLLKFVRQHRI